MEPIETYEHRGYRIEVHPDYGCESPREWDNLCHIWCWHRRYDLGDNPDGNKPPASAFDSWSEIEKFLFEEEGAVEVIPLYLLDHSGLWLRAGRGFSDVDPHGWDWGQIGYAFVTRADLRKEFGLQRISKKATNRASAILRAEIDTYASYISGNVYGYVTMDEDGETVDSCWGFYGDDARSEDCYMLNEAKATIDALIEHAGTWHPAYVMQLPELAIV